MYTIIIFAVIGAALFAYTVREDWKFVFVGLIASMALSFCTPKEKLVYGPTELVSLRTTDGISGIQH